MKIIGASLNIDVFNSLGYDIMASACSFCHKREEPVKHLLWELYWYFCLLETEKWIALVLHVWDATVMDVIANIRRVRCFIRSKEENSGIHRVQYMVLVAVRRTPLLSSSSANNTITEFLLLHLL